VRRLMVLFYSISCIEEKKCTTKMSFGPCSCQECSLVPRADIFRFGLLAHRGQITIIQHAYLWGGAACDWQGGVLVENIVSLSIFSIIN